MAEPLATFDPDATFVAPKNMRFNGEAVLAGRPLNTDGVPERKLAQLYKLRLIRVQTEADLAAPQGAPGALSASDQERAQGLVDGNTRDELNALAGKAKIDNPVSYGTKLDLAQAIVRADPDGTLTAPDEPDGLKAGDRATIQAEGDERNGKSGQIVSIADGLAALKLDGENGETIEGIELDKLVAEAAPESDTGSGGRAE
jgi:hypothetical protein